MLAIATTLSRQPALNVKVMEIQTSGCEIIGILKKFQEWKECQKSRVDVAVEVISTTDEG